MKIEKEAGTTLAETVVTLTLAVLLMAMAGSLLTFGFTVSGRLQASARSAVVMDLLMNCITDTLETAESSSAETGGSGVRMERGVDSRWIAFRDRQGKTISIFAMEEGKAPGSGRLFLMGSDDGEEPVPVFEDAAYEGFVIGSLAYTRVNKKNGGEVIEIRLQLTHLQSGKIYEESRYVSIFNESL